MKTTIIIIFLTSVLTLISVLILIFNKRRKMDFLKASSDGHIEIVKELINKEVNVNHKNKFGKTDLDYAKENGYNNIIELLSK